MSDFPVIGIVGLPGSGKTEVAKRMMELGASRVRMGDVVWREVERRGLEVSEEKVANVANELREKEGPAAIAKRCVPLIKKKGGESEAVIVDGIRGGAEVEVFKEAFGEDFSLIKIEASEETRYARTGSRKREDDIEGWEAFRAKDERELGWGMGEAMEMADFKIINEGSLEDLRNRATVLFKEVVGKESED